MPTPGPTPAAGDRQTPRSKPPRPTTSPNPTSVTRRGAAWLKTRMHRMASWLGTSEPSAQALTQHRRDAFARVGVSPGDAEARSKLHAPIGTIPRDAIRSVGGPRPEEVMRMGNKGGKGGVPSLAWEESSISIYSSGERSMASS
ncbi:hypothetical protein BT67DRAFT_444294 [Trichocladium antarcticum]|uniref:Uncharacterized protein n=1 Tax=Trichocladium antarcticum TaxID=1450529 RepID=A0AAN6UFQ4_9PEZI|nr:hypothetical protein BT67DRAFT_444294 [Trichocladium antarcticum]